jgi:hypothetical protein
MARTLAEAREEYTKVRTAYLKAVEAESYTLGAGGATRTVTRPIHWCSAAADVLHVICNVTR